MYRISSCRLATLGRMRSHLVVPAIVSGFVAGILFVGIHIFTVYLAYLSGLPQMLLTLIFPIGAQIYWVLHIWRLTGTFLNVLTGLCLIWVLVLVSALILSRASRETG
jgi:hypothetical protein